MQTSPNDERGGVVQWVVPPPTRLKKGLSKSPANKSKFTRQQNSSNRLTTLDERYNSNQNLNDSGICEDLSINRSTQVNGNKTSNTNHNINGNKSDNSNKQPIVDLSVCRTISTFVGVHLRDLNERQQRINQARSKMTSAKLYNQHHESSPDNIYVAPKDDTKLKVRDEQTKAIESIKQLTNYLKELSCLKRHCDSSSDQIDEEVVTKLSDLRTEIIQALNDFVLSNSDINIPILDSESYEYDLCMDARLSKNDSMNSGNNKIKANTSSVEKKSINRERYQATASDRSPPSSIDSGESTDDSIEQQAHREIMCVNLEKRRREVQKLERDTVELRRLFLEFYNLIKEQGEQLDGIEENIVITTQRISEGQHHLKRAMKGLTILVPVTGCITGALIGGPLGIIIGGKLGGITVGCATSLLGLLSSYSLQRCIGSTNARLKLD